MKSLLRIHLMTLIFATTLAALLISLNLTADRYAIDWDDDHSQIHNYGWPLVACWTVPRDKGTGLDGLNLFVATLDGLFCLSLLTIVVIPLEWSERRRPWLRWYVASSIWLIGVFEMMCWHDTELKWACYLSGLLAPFVASNLITAVLVARSVYMQKHTQITSPAVAD